jgi:cell fate regulator YaaT (PSP1 superfamily)
MKGNLYQMTIKEVSNDNDTTLKEQSPSSPKEKSEKTSQDTKSSKYQTGDLLKFVRVRFPGNAKSFPFVVERRNFHYGQKVLAMSDRGITVGYINSFPYEVPFNKSMLPIKSISKEATAEDIINQKNFSMKEREAEVNCLHLIEKYQLDMTLTHVEFLQFGKKAVFYFNAPTRVDFRNLVKDLVKDLKMRIELRQISVRDRAAALGAIGPCGLQTCCSSFLKSYGNVSIKLAKNQNLALIANKINGACGQIKCCVKYEDEVYSEKRRRLPKEGELTFLQNGEKGKVTKVQLLAETFEMMTDQGKLKKYEGLFYDAQKKLPENWSFPSSFEYIVNETSALLKMPRPETASPKEQEEKTHQLENTMAPKKEDQKAASQPEQTEKKLDSKDKKRRRYHKNRGQNPGQRPPQRKKNPQ